MALSPDDIKRISCDVALKRARREPLDKVETMVEAFYMNAGSCHACGGDHPSPVKVEVRV